MNSEEHRAEMNEQTSRDINDAADKAGQTVRLINKRPGRVFDESKYFDKSKFCPIRLADDILNDYDFIAFGGVLFVYYEGVYLAGGEQVVREECVRRLGDQFSRARSSEVEFALGIRCYQEHDALNSDGDTINLKNGLLNTTTKELSSHTPEYLSTVQLPVSYDPYARCPAIDKFLVEVLPADCISIILDFVGYLLLLKNIYESSLMLVGSGRNGKGTLLKVIMAFLGKENITAISLQELCESRFARAELFSKLANVFCDLPNRELRNSSFFKMVTSGDVIGAERKHKDHFKFAPFSKLVYSCNELPTSHDKTFAFYRRWIIVPFPNTFTGADIDYGLIDKLTTDEELSGLLNQALEGKGRLQGQNGFVLPQSADKALLGYMEKNETPTAFINEECMFDTTQKTGKTQLFNRYVSWCEDGNIPARQIYTRIEFNKLVEERFGLKETRVIDGVKKIRVWVGINIKNEEGGE